MRRSQMHMIALLIVSRVAKAAVSAQPNRPDRSGTVCGSVIIAEPGNRQRRDSDGPHALGIKCFRNLRMFMDIPARNRNFIVLYFLVDVPKAAKQPAPNLTSAQLSAEICCQLQ